MIIFLNPPDFQCFITPSKSTDSKISSTSGVSDSSLSVVVDRNPNFCAKYSRRASIESGFSAFTILLDVDEVGGGADVDGFVVFASVSISLFCSSSFVISGGDTFSSFLSEISSDNNSVADSLISAGFSKTSKKKFMSIEISSKQNPYLLTFFCG